MLEAEGAKEMTVRNLVNSNSPTSSKVMVTGGKQMVISP